MDRKDALTLGKMAENVLSGKGDATAEASRRVWLQNLGLISASAAVLWNCGKKSDTAAAPAAVNPATDAALYAQALALENNAIGTYIAAAGLPNIKDPTTENGNGVILEIASGFLAHHQAHAGLLQAAITALKNANPSAGIPAPEATVTTAASVPDATVKLLTDSTYGIVNILRLAASAELGAAQAYISLIPKFTDPTNAMLHTLISGDEAAHYGVLRAALFGLFKDTRDTSLTGTAVVSAPTIDKCTATAPA